MAETVLWEHIRDEALGVKFLRQHIIGDYIVDFLARSEGLIIEVDGAYHAERKQKENDAIRTDFLQKWDFKFYALLMSKYYMTPIMLYNRLLIISKKA